MEFIIVTGISGAGKSTALKFFEDNDYYCVDNLPIMLLKPFGDILYSQSSDMKKVVVGIDIRSGGEIEHLGEVLDEMKLKDQEYQILFIDADDDVIIRRYSETRRSHPLGKGERVEAGLKAERELLEPLRERADIIIDSSDISSKELQEEVKKAFISENSRKKMTVTVMSFGFKYGLPIDCDLVFDVRFLPNPYYVPELKHKTGLSLDVQSYVMNSDISQEFLDRLKDMMEFLVPCYIEEGKSRLVVGIGCTGGKHRSVTIAGKLYDELKASASGCDVVLFHRDIER